MGGSSFSNTTKHHANNEKEEFDLPHGKKRGFTRALLRAVELARQGSWARCEPLLDGDTVLVSRGRE
ncbi:hypothetical protein ACFX12_040372 [Malus domestica]